MKFQIFIRLLCTLMAVIVSGMITYTSVQSPLKNWDIVGYTATILAQQGFRDDDLHAKTWDSLSESLGDIKVLQEGIDYLEAVAKSPEALMQQLPYYKPRIGYLFFAAQLAKITSIDIPRATVLASALSISLLFLLVYFALMRCYSSAVALILTLSLTACLHWLWLSRASTPDAMASLLTLCAVLFFRRNNVPFFIAFCSLLILVRHDQIILVGFLVLFHPGLKKWQKAASLVFFGVIFSGVYLYSRWYGWSLLFMHTFSVPQAYPASSSIALSDVAIQYFRQWKSIIYSMARDTQSLLPIGALIVAICNKKPALENDRRLIDALMLAIFFKIAMFPVVSGSWARLHMGEIVSIIVIAMTLSKAKNVADLQTKTRLSD